MLPVWPPRERPLALKDPPLARNEPRARREDDVAVLGAGEGKGVAEIAACSYLLAFGLISYRIRIVRHYYRYTRARSLFSERRERGDSDIIYEIPFKRS